MNKKSISIIILIITAFFGGYLFNDLINKSSKPIQHLTIAIQDFLANRSPQVLHLSSHLQSALTVL